MNVATSSPMLAATRAWHALVHEIVDIVPDSMACCEFECHRAECGYREWATCERRLAYASKSHSPCAVCEDDTVAAS